MDIKNENRFKQILIYDSYFTSIEKSLVNCFNTTTLLDLDNIILKHRNFATYEQFLDYINFDCIRSEIKLTWDNIHHYKNLITCSIDDLMKARLNYRLDKHSIDKKDCEYSLDIFKNSLSEIKTPEEYQYYLYNKHLFEQWLSR